MFKAIVEGARKFKRAITEDGGELPVAAEQFGTAVAQALIAGRFGDVHAMMTPSQQQRTTRDVFEMRWREAVRERGPLTGFDISNAGQIDLAFIPGLEDVPQSQFVAFVEIAFSTPDVSLDDDKAFTIGVVLLDHAGEIRVGAVHAR
jgi:hypothetical protein